MKIEGKEVLSYIIERAEQVVSREQIILATSNQASDEPIASFAKRQGIKCYRGSLENVARRFYEAAAMLKGDYACRINGDNIFLDVAVLKTMIEKAQTGKFSFLSNVKDRTYPKGMSVEIVGKNYYATHLPTIEKEAYYREHVMVYLYERAAADKHFYLINERHPQASGLQLALDTKDDFERSRWIIKRLTKPHYKAGMADILEIFKEYEKSVEG